MAASFAKEKPMIQKSIALTAGRVIGLALAHVVLLALASRLVLPTPTPTAPAEIPTWQLPLDGLLMAAMTAYLVLTSRLRGWALAGALFVLLFGTRTLMTQIETAAFPAALHHLPADTYPRLYPLGALHLGAFSLAAVWMLGRFKGENQPRAIELAPRAGGRAVLAAFVYMALYALAGYYIAWQSPDVRAYYGGEDLSFIAQWGKTIADAPWMPFFQFARGLLWTGLTALALRVSGGSAGTAALGASLLFAVGVGSQLFIPGPHMPEPVRMAHLLECAGSMLIYGAAATTLLARRRAPLGNALRSAMAP